MLYKLSNTERIQNGCRPTAVNNYQSLIKNRLFCLVGVLSVWYV